MTPSAEDELIARVFAPIAGPAALGLRDDAGLLAVPSGCELVVTKDALAAGVHFFPDDPPGSIARKALGVNLSDLAAKAASPAGFLLAIALPPEWRADWLDAFGAALGEEARRRSCPLIGGDTVSTTGPLVLSITALGFVEAGRMLPRTGARAGDRLYVSGTIGDGALGLTVRGAERAATAPAWVAALDPHHRAALRDRYLHPEPRLGLQAALRHAAGGMDVSDGLVGDLSKMLRVSGVSGRVELARVPLSAAAAAALAIEPGLFETVLTGGDDYEIMASVPAVAARAFEAAAAAAGIAVTAIGDVVAGTASPVFVDADGDAASFGRPAFSHA